MMTDPRLTAMVPVDVYIAHEKKRWKKMPFLPLMSRLADMTKGRILQVDQPTSAAGGADNSFVQHVAESGSTIKVAGPNDEQVERSLYVEFTLDA